MSTPDPNFAERVARAWWQIATGEQWTEHNPEKEPGAAHVWDGMCSKAREWLAAIEAAGLAVVELPEPTSVEPDHVAWRGAELSIHDPGATTIWPSLPDDQNGWDDAPGYVRDYVAPALLAAAAYAERQQQVPS